MSAPPRRCRPTPRPTLLRRGRRPRTYGAVLEATSQLLETTSLAELSVAQILAAAVSGARSFYEHFTSKDDVVVKLLGSLSDEVADGADADVRARRALEPTRPSPQGLSNLIETPLALRAAGGRGLRGVARDPGAQAIWFGMLGDFTDAAGAHDRVRAGGRAARRRAPTRMRWPRRWCGPPSARFTWRWAAIIRRLWTRATVMEPLTQLFVGTIYGRPVRREPCGRRGARPPGARSGAHARVAVP